MFSHSLGCLFTPSIVSFDAQKFLTLRKFNLFFSYVACAFGFASRKLLPSPVSRSFAQMSFSCVLSF